MLIASFCAVASPVCSIDESSLGEYYKGSDTIAFSNDLLYRFGYCYYYH